MKLSSLNAKNEKIKMNYENYLLNLTSNKVSPKTVEQKLGSIRKFEAFIKRKDFIIFDASIGVGFYKYLDDSDIQPLTKMKDLNNVRDFLKWYLDRTNHKKTQIEALNTLIPSRKDKQLANTDTYKEFPTKQEVDKLVKIEPKTIKEKRDSALIAFIAITGIRANALTTLKLKLVNSEKGTCIQDPNCDVKTKRSKYIATKFMVFDEEYKSIVDDWIRFLKEEQNFDGDCPVFPTIKTYSNEEVLTKKFLSGEQACEKIVSNACIRANIGNYTPHSFRHFIANMGMEKATNAIQFKALSQNFGHDMIITLIKQYANMTPEQYFKVVDNLFKQKDFSVLNNFSTDELMVYLRTRIKDVEGFN